MEYFGKKGAGASPEVRSQPGGPGRQTLAGLDEARTSGHQGQVHDDNQERRGHEDAVKSQYLKTKRTLLSEYEIKMRQDAQAQAARAYDPVKLREAFKDIPLLPSMIAAAQVQHGHNFLIVEGPGGTQSNPHTGFVNIHQNINDKHGFAMALMQELHNVSAQGIIETLDLAAMGVGTKGTGPIDEANYVALAEEIEYRGVIKRLKALYLIQGQAVLAIPAFARVKDLLPQMLEDSSELRSGQRVSPVFKEYFKRLSDEHKASHTARYQALVHYRQQLDEQLQGPHHT